MQTSRNRMQTSVILSKNPRIYWKCHITTILGLQIILAAFATSGSVSDMTMLLAMLAEIRRRGFDIAGCVFDCDKGYDSDHNCRLIFEMGMTPNIKQRRNTVSRGKPHRKKAAGLFDGEEYKEDPDRRRVRSRGGPKAPAALPVRPGRQPAAVCQGKGHILEHPGSQPV